MIQYGLLAPPTPIGVDMARGCTNRRAGAYGNAIHVQCVIFHTPHCTALATKRPPHGIWCNLTSDEGVRQSIEHTNMFYICHAIIHPIDEELHNYGALVVQNTAGPAVAFSQWHSIIVWTCHACIMIMCT